MVGRQRSYQLCQTSNNRNGFYVIQILLKRKMLGFYNSSVPSSIVFMHAIVVQLSQAIFSTAIKILVNFSLKIFLQTYLKHTLIIFFHLFEGSEKNRLAYRSFRQGSGFTCLLDRYPAQSHSLGLRLQNVFPHRFGLSLCFICGLNQSMVTRLKADTLFIIIYDC